MSKIKYEEINDWFLKMINYSSDKKQAEIVFSAAQLWNSVTLDAEENGDSS